MPQPLNIWGAGIASPGELRAKRKNATRHLYGNSHFPPNSPDLQVGPDNLFYWSSGSVFYCGAFAAFVEKNRVHCINYGLTPVCNRLALTFPRRRAVTAKHITPGLLITAVRAIWSDGATKTGIGKRNYSTPNAVQATADTCSGRGRINIVDILLLAAWHSRLLTLWIKCGISTACASMDNRKRRTNRAMSVRC